MTASAGVGFRGYTHGAVAGDVNNDGFPDLFLTNYGPNVLYLNNGDGTFRDASAGSGLEKLPWSTGAAFLDYDGDGNLDVYVSCYGEWTAEGEHPYCGDRERKVRIYCSPYSITPAAHHLYRNRGDGTFEETTEPAGVGRKDGRGLGVIAADVNRDGLADLFVANDGCPRFLFLNRGGGRFEDVSESSGAALNEAGEVQGSMGLDVEDLDGDGWPELFVSNFRGQYNTLYGNHHGTNFVDVSASAGIVSDSLPWVGRGSPWPTLTTTAFPTCSSSTVKWTTTSMSSVWTRPSGSRPSSGATWGRGASRSPGASVPSSRSRTSAAVRRSATSTTTAGSTSS